MQLDIKVNDAQLREVTEALRDVPKGLQKALAGAVNDTVRSTVTFISTKIRDRINIKKKDIDPHLKRTKATVSRPSAAVKLSESERLGVKYFGAKQSKKGVSYKIEKGGKRQLIERAFIAERIGGHVFKRQEDPSPPPGHRRKGTPVLVKRLKIFKKMGASPWGVFVKAGLEKVVVPDSAEKLQKNLDRKVAWLLSQRKPGGATPP